MPKIYKNDIDVVNAFTKNSLGNEVSDATGLINKINSFIQESATVLVGEGWDKERMVLSQYISLLEQRITVVNELVSAITSANSTMSNYMGSDSVIDDSKLEELYQTLAYNQNLIRQYQADSKSTGIDNNNLISQYYDVVDDINAQVNRLEQLVPTDNSAYGNLQNVDATLSSYESSVSSKQVSNIVL